MNLISDKNEKLVDDGFFHFASGTRSKVYKRENILLKAYNDDTISRFCITRKMFLFLREHQINNIVQLLNYYEDHNAFLYKIAPVFGYTMKYVNGERVNLIDCDRNFLFDISRKLSKVIFTASNYGIVFFDVNENNLILTKNDVTIIDPDQFYFEFILSRKKILIANKKELLRCIKLLLIKEFKEQTGKVIDFSIIDDDSMSFLQTMKFNFPEKTVRDSVLSKVKRPL